MATKKYSFQKLTPVSNADISVYEEAIDFVFDNADVKNVAISGPYSAGKSSILESYKIRHKNYRFVHLSLAHFRTPEQENIESQETIKEPVLEGKILNQLIHQIPAERIPQTNFRVKKGVSAKNLTFLTVFSSVFIGSIVFLLSSSRAASFVAALPDDWIKNILSVLFSAYANIPATIICATCAVVLIFSLIKAQKNKNIFRKISLQGNEIEIFDEQDDSYFDKYLNEVLYLFENVEANVIVFEDMDRFNASRIFERLREVNTLVNIQRKKEHGCDYVPLRFFYLLRDDIFISKDRTKFFDYIIPIVPILDSSNSYEQFLKHLKDGNLLDKFNQSFLQSLSLYVDDMRILKNIYNEFVVYIHRLNTTDLDWNKMMAMIVYKNLFPRDFSDLQLARGFVFALFEQKPLLIKKAFESAHESRKELLDRIKCAKKEILTSQQELDDAYAAKNGRLPREGYYNHLTPQGKELEEQYYTELPKRKQAVQDNLDGNLSKLESELAEIEHDITLTQTKPLKDFVTRENIGSIFSLCHTNEIGVVNEFKEIKGSDYFSLLKFLIRNGYIDETYTDYMTYFYEDSISANDKTFLRRVADRRGAEYTYALREPQKVIESPVLRVVEFEQEEALNFDLLECLLINNTVSKYATYLRTLITQIKKTKNFNFVSKFYDTGKAHRQFVISINELWSDFFSLALQEKTISSAQIRKYSIDTLYFSDEEVITTVNVNSCLTEYISQCPDYLAIERPDIDKLISGFLLIGVSFAAIDYYKSEKTLFDEVYRHSLYTLSFENISLMLKKEYGIKSDSDIAHKNYTLIKSQVDSPLAEYISENMSMYTELVLSNCNGKITDDEGVVINFLNNGDVDIEAKNCYIDMLITTITDLTQVTEKDLWADMLNREIVIFSIFNFIHYFKTHGIDEALIKYINDAPSEVDFTHAADDFSTEIAESLFDAVAICNSITTEKYKKILIDLDYQFDNFNADDIADEKFEVLIGEGILQMDASGLKFVREKYEKYIYSFINHNLDDYLTLQDADIFRLEETLQIITWNIDDEKKKGLLSFTNEPISIIGMQYSDELNADIITHNLKEEERVHLYAHYEQYGEKTLEAITTLAQADVSKIITNKMEIHDGLLSILLQSDEVSRDQKIMLFTMAIPNLTEETCKIHFDELALPDLKEIFTKWSGRRNYEKSNDVTKILEALKSNNWIYEYRDDERNSDRYIVIKNRPRSKAPEFLD